MAFILVIYLSRIIIIKRGKKERGGGSDDEKKKKKKTRKGCKGHTIKFIFLVCLRSRKVFKNREKKGGTDVKNKSTRQ